MKLNLKSFLAMMSDDDLREINSALYFEQTARAEKRIEGFSPLNKDELKVGQASAIAAIKAYRDRTGCTLLEARLMVTKSVKSSNV